jgi:hypothetical protein
MPESPKARHWLLTIPQHCFTPFLPQTVVYIKGQLECGEETGYIHWQLLASFGTQVRLPAVKRIFGDSCHAEPSKSVAADGYVWKEETAIDGTRFELGKKPFKRNSPNDWEAIVRETKAGRLDDIPPDVFVRCYGNLRRIAADYCSPIAIEREVKVYWGRTGTGKSRRAWAEAGLDAFPKDPRSKFWDGYRGHENVVIDEFRGDIDISHILRWLDRYPTIVEIKGGATTLKAKNIWITSNISPHQWYPHLGEETRDALLRRLNITHFP